ncbi:maturase K [Striga asiatica]|uniref:Maturase K n=1 Tax=Striga asiatica TaxID=4170 RepID=A0A5A7QXS4_STRAF|nr:maturase K [Striga asiatica]
MTKSKRNMKPIERIARGIAISGCKLKLRAKKDAYRSCPQYEPVAIGRENRPTKLQVRRTKTVQSSHTSSHQSLNHANVEEMSEPAPAILTQESVAPAELPFSLSQLCRTMKKKGIPPLHSASNLYSHRTFFQDLSLFLKPLASLGSRKGIKCSMTNLANKKT